MASNEDRSTNNQQKTMNEINSTSSSSTHRSNNSSYSNNYSRTNKPVRRKNYNYFNEQPVFTCLVCCQDYPSFKRKAIFAIGPCNHMVCYYCSTKMRVLCDQTECPTCRQELSEVDDFG